MLNATLDRLVEAGYAGMSTPEICKRAGLSRGALLHHFPTKAALVTAAMAHVANRRTVEIIGAANDTAADPAQNPLGTVFGLMWQAFEGPLYHAALELWVAARTDTELRAALLPVERNTGKGLYLMWRLVPDAQWPAGGPARERFDDLLQLTLHMLRGMALQKLLKKDDAQRVRLFAVWQRMALREMREIQRQATDR